MKNNYCVIMGGGIGSRFWPFSREDRPKQFLDFFGIGRSLLQMTVDRFARIIPMENIYIVTNCRYAELVREQLPLLREEQILLEPERRNTAPCIAYAAYHIKAVNPAANIVVAPSDHLITKEDEFVKAIRKALDFVRKTPSLITLAVKPSRPETNYGYVQISRKRKGEFIKVKSFTEKPDLKLAKIFQESGEFFWNSGIFLWNVDAILEAIRKFLPYISTRFDPVSDKFNTPAEKALVEEIFPSFQNMSIDYGVMEKSDNVYMLCVDFGWADLGTWGAIFDTAPHDSFNNAVLNRKNILFYDTSDNIVAVENPKRLVVIQGLTDYLIAESGNILLICRKGEEQQIKRYMTDAQIKFGDEFI